MTRLADTLTSTRITLGVTLTLAAVAFAWPAWADITHIARRDEEASHIWLVPLVAGWLMWVRRHRLQNTPMSYTMLGPIVMAAGGLVGYVGFHHAMQSLWHGGAVLLAIGALLSVTGRQWLLAAWPAVLVLALLVPVPNTLRQQFAMPMQQATAEATAYVFTLLGMPVQRVGNVLAYRGVDVAVAEACNGMRMIFVLVLMCYTVAFAWPLVTGVRVVLLALSPLCAIACNVIRLVPTVWLYGIDEQTLGPLFHDISGWAMVFVAFGLALGMVRTLHWVGVDVERKVAPSSVSTDASTNKRVSDNGQPQRRWLIVVTGAAAVVLLAVGVEASARPSAADAAAFHAAVRDKVESWPDEVAGWVGQEAPLPREAVQLLRPNAMLSRSYHHPSTGRRATLVLVHTRDARDMAGHYPPNCYPANGWQQRDTQPYTFTLPPDDLTFHATAYRFVYGQGAEATHMHVINFLMLPTGEIVPDIAHVRRAAADYTRHFHGAAQVQLITDPDLSNAERRALTRDLLAAHRPLLDLLRNGRPFWK